MSSKRIELQSKLEELLGSKNIYFQPPANISISYPAIVYEITKVNLIHADNSLYKGNKCYLVTLIHKNPDNDVFDKLIEFGKCRFNRHYVSDNLHHYVFEIFY